MWNDPNTEFHGCVLFVIRWSYGVVLYELFTLGGVPFPLLHPADMTKHLNSGHRLEQPEDCPDNMYVFSIKPSS